MSPAVARRLADRTGALPLRPRLGYPATMLGSARFGLTSLWFSAALLLGFACGDSGGAGQDTATCTVGSAGCPCTDGGGCDPGLECVASTCTAPGASTGTDTGAPTTGGASEVGSGSATQTATSAPTTGPAAETGTSTGAGDDSSSGDGPKLDVGVEDTTTGVPTEGCRKIDMLFVLDGSGSMNEERSALAAVDAFTDIVTTLSNLNGEIDYRIAVTTDNDDGYVTPNNCWKQPNPWIDSVGNTPPDVAQAFNCAVSGFGNNNFEADVGCEHVLTSAVDLLDGDPSGFVRKDALLVLVLVTDVDDYGAYDQQDGNDCGIGCATPPPPLASLTQRLISKVKNDEADGVAAIVVAGDPAVDAGKNFCGQPGSCGCGGIDCGVFHATRLYEFATMLGANGFAADICGGAKAVPTAVEAALNDSIDLACMKFDPPV